MIKVLDEIDNVLVLSEYLKIKDGITWIDFGSKSRQAGLQYKQDEDPWSSAVGKSKGNETLYNNLNPLIQGSLFENLILKYNLKRSRFLNLGPNSTYSMHKDASTRIHLPIITNKQCFMVFKEGLVEHLHMGKVYWTDTTKEHTAINCSELWRLHFVGVVDDN